MASENDDEAWAANLAAEWLDELVHDFANDNATEFSRKTKIDQPSISNVLNRKGRDVTWLMVARIAAAKDLPSISELLARLARKFADAAIAREMNRPARPPAMTKELRDAVSGLEKKSARKRKGKEDGPHESNGKGPEGRPPSQRNR